MVGIRKDLEMVLTKGDRIGISMSIEILSKKELKAFNSVEQTTTTNFKKTYPKCHHSLELYVYY